MQDRFAAARLIGCGVTTGIGAALNVAEIGFGNVVLVLGCGAVGSSVVQGARLAGAGRILTFDAHEPRLELAARLGATDLVRLGERDPAEVARADGRIDLGSPISRRIRPDGINEGFGAPEARGTIRSVVVTS